MFCISISRTILYFDTILHFSYVHFCRIILRIELDIQHLYSFICSLLFLCLIFIASDSFFGECDVFYFYFFRFCHRLVANVSFFASQFTHYGYGNNFVRVFNFICDYVYLTRCSFRAFHTSKHYFQ